VNIDEHDVIIK